MPENVTAKKDEPEAIRNTLQSTFDKEKMNKLNRTRDVNTA